MPEENIDTDQIIPARFLKATTREGFGENLFRDWRYDAAGNPKPDFVLNNPTYSGAILVAGKNFGCGSSREHAAWALVDYGFQAVVSSFFGDIFRNNALNNSLLPIVVEQKLLDKLLSAIERNPQTGLQVDLENQRFLVPNLGIDVVFEINEYKKMCIMNGYDDVDYLLSMRPKIQEFEQSRTNDFSITS